MQEIETILRNNNMTLEWADNGFKVTQNNVSVLMRDIENRDCTFVLPRFVESERMILLDDNQ